MNEHWSTSFYDDSLQLVAERQLSECLVPAKGDFVNIGWAHGCVRYVTRDYNHNCIDVVLDWNPAHDPAFMRAVAAQRP